MLKFLAIIQDLIFCVYYVFKSPHNSQRAVFSSSLAYVPFAETLTDVKKKRKTEKLKSIYLKGKLVKLMTSKRD